MGRALLAMGAVLALGLSACGSEGSKSGDKAQEPARLAIKLTGSAKKPTFSAPKTVKGGPVEVAVTNNAQGQHSAQLLGIGKGHTSAQALTAANGWGTVGKKLPDWVRLAGGLGNVKPGQTATATQRLKPGSYTVVDLESHASAKFTVEPAVSGKAPSDGAKTSAHGYAFDARGRNGSKNKVLFGPDSRTASSAAGTATISAHEYAFDARGLKAGKNEVLFDNTGAQPHFVAAAKMKPGKTLADVRKFIKTQKGNSPVDEQSSLSTAVIDGGTKQGVELNLQRGQYALLCFVPDRQGGPPHAVKGMVSEATVR